MNPIFQLRYRSIRHSFCPSEPLIRCRECFKLRCIQQRREGCKIVLIALSHFKRFPKLLFAPLRGCGVIFVDRPHQVEQFSKVADGPGYLHPLYLLVRSSFSPFRTTLLDKNYVSFRYVRLVARRPSVKVKYLSGHSKQFDSRLILVVVFAGSGNNNVKYCHAMKHIHDYGGKLISIIWKLFRKLVGTFSSYVKISLP